MGPFLLDFAFLLTLVFSVADSKLKKGYADVSESQLFLSKSTRPAGSKWILWRGSAHLKQA